MITQRHDLNESMFFQLSAVIHTVCFAPRQAYGNF